MKPLLPVIVFLLLFSCQTAKNPYAGLSIRQCDSLLEHTALSSRERTLVIMQYAHLHTQGDDNTNKITSSRQDSCLKMLREVLLLAPKDLSIDLKITILPFYFSKLTQHNPQINKEVRKIMSDIESSSLNSGQQARYLNYKAQYYTILRSPCKAFQFCEQAREKFRENKDKQGEFNILSQMALLYLIQKDYTTAIRYCDSAKNLQGHTPTSQEQQRLYSQYSVLYAHIGDYNRAIQARQLSGTDTIHNSSLANLYIAAGKYDKALHIIEQQYQEFKANPFRENYYLRSKAEIYEAAGKYEQAAIFRQQAIDMAEANSVSIRKRHPELPGIPVAFATVYATQAKWVWNKGNHQEAINLLRKAEMLTLRSVNVNKENIELLEQLAQYYRKQGDFRSALTTILRRDSLSELINSQNQSISQDYFNKLSEQEIEILNATIDKQKAELHSTHCSHFYLILSLALLTLCIGLSLLYYRKIRKKEK